MNEFIINIIASLNKQLSKKAINNDLKTLDNAMHVKVLAKLSKSLASKELKRQLKKLDNLYVNVGVKADKGAKDRIQKNIRELQQSISDIEVGLKASKPQQKGLESQIENIRKDMQGKVSPEPLEFNLQLRKNQLISDIEYTGKRFSKLFSSGEASKKYEEMMQRALSISDKGQLSDTRAELSAFISELKAAGLASQSLGDRWKGLVARAKDLFSAASIVRVTFSQVREAVRTAIDLDKAYTGLIKVQSELSRGSYPDYLGRCNRKAQELATTQKALMEGAEEFSKSGYDLSTSDRLTEKSTILANVGEMSASDSARAIISGIQAYDVVDGYTDVADKAQALIDKYNELGNTASITTKELAQGVQSVGSVFADANTSVDEFLALLSAGNRQFQNADSLALALRTSALRIRSATAELEEAGEDIEGVMSTLDNQEAIKALTSVDILESDQKTIRSIYDIFLDISKVYKDMDDADQSSLLNILAGKHRASAISATLNNMEEAERLLQDSFSAAGSAQREYDAYLESTEAHLQQFQAKLVETYSTFMNGDMVSHAADLGTAILDLVNKTDLLKHSLIAIAALKVGQGISVVGGAISGAVTQMNTLGNALQQVKDLPVDDNLRKNFLDDIGKSTKSLTEKNLSLLLSQKQLTDDDKEAILVMHDLTEEEAKAKLEKLGLTTATNADTAANTANAASVNISKGAFTGLATSIKATWAAMSMLQKASIIIGVVSALWSVASSAISKYKQSQEDLRQSVDGLMSSYESAVKAANANANRIEGLAEKYKTLSDGVDNLGKNVSLTTEEYAEYNDIVSQIADMFPTLVTGYTEEGNAILSLKGNVEQLRDAYKEAQQEAYNMLISSGKDSDGNDIIKNWKNLHETSGWDRFWDFGADDVGGGISVADAIKELEAFSRINAEAYRKIRIKQTEAVGSPDAFSSLSADEKIIASSNYLDKALGITFSYNINDKDFAQVQKQARVLAQTYSAEINAALKNVQAMANAYLNTNVDYAALDSKVKSAASVIVNTLDENIASQFDEIWDVGGYVDNIVQMLKDNPDISDSLVALFDLDYSDMSIEDAKAVIDMYIKSIAGMLEEDDKELKIRLGFTEVDELDANYQKVLDEAAKKASGISDAEFVQRVGRIDYWEAIREELEEFAEQHSINTQDELAAFAKALEDANYDIEQAFANYLNTPNATKATTPFTTLSESQSDAIKSYKDTLSSITDIFDDFKNVDITELMSTFEGYDWSGYLSGAESLDTALRKIANQSLQAVIDQFEGLSGCEKILDELKQKFEDTFSLDFGLSESMAAYDELIALLERVRKGEKLHDDEVTGLINKYPELASAIDGVAGQYGVEESAIVSLINTQVDLVNTGIAAQREATRQTIETVKDRIHAYKTEYEFYQNALKSFSGEGDSWRNGSQYSMYQSELLKYGSLNLDKVIEENELYLKELEGKYAGLLTPYKHVEKEDKDKTNSSSSSKQVFDWIEKAANNASSALSKLKSKISDIYQTWTSRNKAVDNAIKQTKDNIETNSKAYAAYMDKANAVGLDPKWQEKIKEGSFSISEIDPNRKYGGISGSTLIQQIQDFQEWYEKAKACEEEAEALNTELKELANTRFDNLKIPFDNKNTRINLKKDKIQSKIDTIEAGGGYLTNGSYYEELIKLEKEEKRNNLKAREKLIKQLQADVDSGLLEKGSEAYEKRYEAIKAYTEAILGNNENIAGWEKSIQDIAFDMSERRLGRLDDILDGMKEKISDTSLTWEKRNKAIDDSAEQTSRNIKAYEKDIAGWQAEADTIDLSDEWKEKIMGGDYDLTGITDASLLDLIQQFETLWAQISKNQDKVDGLNNSFKDLAKARVDNITAQFDGILADFEHRKNMIEGEIGIAQAKGHLVGASYYSELKKAEEGNLAALQAERKQLVEAMNAPIDGDGNFLEKGSEGYKELEKQVYAVTEEIQNSEKSLIGYDNEIRQIAWDMADFIQDTISQLTDEADFYADLMKNKDLYSDGGKLNSYGMATLGMHGLNYNTYMEQSIGYARELEELERQLAEKPYSKDLIERYRERLGLQRDMVLAAEDEKQAMVDMVRDGIDAELDSLKELIDTYKDTLDAQKDLYDFQKKVDSQTQKISDIEKQILAYENDGSEEAKAKIQQLKVNLSDAKEDLEDTQYAKYISDQKELLDGLYQDYEGILNQRLDDVDALFESLIADVNANAGSIRETLEAEAGKVGLNLSSEMQGLWGQPSKGENEISEALKVYKGDFTGYREAFGAYAESFQKYYTEYGEKTKEQNGKLDGVKESVETESQKEVDKLSEVKGDTETLKTDLSNYVGAEGTRYTTLESIFTTMKDAVNDIYTLMKSEDFPKAVKDAIGILDTSVKTGFSNLAAAYSKAAEDISASGLGSSGSHSDDDIGYSQGGLSSVFIPAARKDTYPKNKLDKENSIVDRLRYFDFEYDFPYREYYYSALGGSGTYTGTESQNKWLLKKMKSMGYRKGIYNLKQDEVAWTQEGQPELVRTSDGAMLMPLQAGSTVFDSTATKNLFDFGNAPEDFLIKRSPSIPGLNSVPKSIPGSSIDNNIELNIMLPNVTDYNELLYAFQHDKRFEKLVQDMSVNLLDGKSPFRKYRQNFK